MVFIIISQEGLIGVRCEKWRILFSPKHAAVAGRKHRALSCVEHDRFLPMPKDRGAEQGGVVGN